MIRTLPDLSSSRQVENFHKTKSKILGKTYHFMLASLFGPENPHGFQLPFAGSGIVNTLEYPDWLNGSKV